jgi:hypothetical protein
MAAKIMIRVGIAIMVLLATGEEACAVVRKTIKVRGRLSVKMKSWSTVFLEVSLIFFTYYFFCLQSDDGDMIDCVAVSLEIQQVEIYTP